MKNDKELDKYTIGNSPAAIYLIDVLNKNENKNINRLILKNITDFRNIFKQLVSAYEDGHIEQKVVKSFMSYKRVEIEKNKNQLKEKGYTDLIINLCNNLIIGDLKKFQRKINKMNMLEKSSSDRARNLLKNQKVSLKNQELKTYGLIGNEKYEIQVNFNKHGLAKPDLSQINLIDEITSDTLMEKSVKRLKRLGKI